MDYPLMITMTDGLLNRLFWAVVLTKKGYFLEIGFIKGWNTTALANNYRLGKIMNAWKGFWRKSVSRHDWKATGG